MNSSSAEPEDRYARQLELLGESGQTSLKKSSAAIVGLGGLGSPAATYLSMAGLGKLVLVDHDEVETSNLNRQFLHWDEDLTRRKSISAREKLSRLNSETVIETFEGKLNRANWKNLPEVDLLVGSVDNFETRYLINECAVERQIPYIHGAVEGFQGQLTTIIPGETPCLQCIFPDNPPGKTGIPILGTTAGIIGTMMANEAIKYLIGQGCLVTGKLLLVDLSSNKFESISIERNSDCQTCGD
ncbi:MAG: ThiF family adenylyltransferase [Candidatus Bipolaricaulia bacterium]